MESEYPEPGKRWLLAENYDFGNYVRANIVSTFTTRKIDNPVEFYYGTNHFPVLCPKVHKRFFDFFGCPADKEMVVVCENPDDVDSILYMVPVPTDI